MLLEYKEYRIKDYVTVKWAKNKTVVGIIQGFNPDDDTVNLELIMAGKKSDAVQRLPKTLPYEDIVGMVELQYGIAQDGTSEASDEASDDATDDADDTDEDTEDYDAEESEG